jgi:DNA-binding NtrC family response regulator
VRFVAATNHDLPGLIEARQFRQDLFYRLNVVPIHVPPLRERAQDIALLARHFIEVYSRRENREPLKMSAAVWRWMSAHSWPGNIRELENLCQRAVALTDGDLFDTDVLALTNAPCHSAPPRPANVNGDRHYQLAHASLDRQLLESTLAQEHGNVLRAAKSLRISRTTFYSKAKKLGVRIRTSR